MPTRILLFQALIQAACHSSDSGQKDIRDSATWQDENGFTVDLSTVDDIPTVIVVEWEVTPGDVSSARVEFGPTTDHGQEAPIDISAGAPYSTFILGSGPETAVHVRIVAEVDGEEKTSADRTITTGPTPAEFPDITVESSGEHWQGYLVTGLIAYFTPVIFDSEGDYVWWSQVEKGGTHQGLTTVLGRTRMAMDGQSILYIPCNAEGQEDIGIHRLALDGTELEVIPTPSAHHDFVELPDGTYVYLAFDPRIVDDEVLYGDRVMEIRPDGTQIEVWNVWDHYAWDGETTIGPGMLWPHANAIDYLPEDDAYLVNFLTLRTVLRIDRPTGETEWTLGGEQSDYTLATGGTDLFDSSHQFEWLDGSLLSFINGSAESGAPSHAVEYALNDSTHVATEVWSYWPEPSISNFALGDVERLESGNTLVTFSVAGAIHEVDPGGGVVWKATASMTGALGYTTRMADLNARSR